jgi:hypothetical protein
LPRIGVYKEENRVISSTFLCFAFFLLSIQRTHKSLAAKQSLWRLAWQSSTFGSKVTELFRVRKARLNNHRDNMQEAPAPTIPPLGSMPDGITDGDSSSSAAIAGTRMEEVIVFMSPAK